MTHINPFASDVQAAEEAGMDQSVVQKGFERKLTPAGPTPMRFVSYIEIGNHVEQYEGKDKDPAPQVRLRFELNGEAHKNEFEKDGEKKVFYNTIDIDIALSQNEKAGFFKLFKKMAYGRDAIKSMPAMLGEAFIGVIHHKKSQKTGKPYPVLKMDGEWQVGAPFTTDPMTGAVTNYDIPAATEKFQMLLWDNPTQQQWDSIFIDGTYEKEVDGKKVEVSKNFIQNKCLEAVNFQGSALEALVGAQTMDMPITLEDTPAEAPKEEKAPETPPAAETPAAPAESAPAAKTDPLAGLKL